MSSILSLACARWGSGAGQGRAAPADNLHPDSRLVTDKSAVYLNQIANHESVDPSQYERPITLDEAMQKIARLKEPLRKSVK